MPVLDIKLDGDNCWPELQSKSPDQILIGTNLQVAFLAGGMASGRASVTFRVDLPDGRVLLVETSHAIFEAAAAAFRGRVAYLEDLKATGGADS